ncbi:hypothetical protein [Streptomyces sp. AS58]|uniref:hypothetical protein n=2 Tax=Streptomyces TaxID=1883 RepID=UPI0006AF8DCA|nr:hypothetical protein [Streptomyces sp. AS58]
MTMERFIKRVSVAVASVAIAGGTLLGAGGSASAATPQSVGHAPSSSTGSQLFGAHGGDDGREWNHHRHSGHHRGDHDRDRCGHGHHAVDQFTLEGITYRWDGHRLFRQIDGRWIDATPYRNGVVDRWYLDQLLTFGR